MQTWLWLAFFASFAVKMPMWPVHTWLPDAHVEAPTAGSVILAAILLKMGGYGFLRFSLPMFPHASMDLAPFVFALSVIAIVYTSLVALVQEDMKKLIAYSSVAHMGFVTMGIFALTTQGIAGGIFQMISHGIVSAALFLCVGVVYDRMHTREISAYGGLVNNMPLYALVFLIFTMANVGLPGTSGFVGEFLALIGTFKANIPVAAIATFGVILSACYALWLYRKVMFGALTSRACGPARHGPARDFRLCAARHPHHPVRRLSEAGARHVGGVGRATARELPAGGGAEEGGRARSGEMNALAAFPSLAAGAARNHPRARRDGAADVRRLQRREGDAGRSTLALVVLLIAAAVFVWLLPAGKIVTFGGSFVVDDFARVMKILALIGSAATIVLARDYLAAEGRRSSSSRS